MKKLYDADHWWKSHSTNFSVCRLLIFEVDGRKVVIASESKENVGASVTDASEDLFDSIYAQFAQKFELDTATILVEHYGVCR